MRRPFRGQKLMPVTNIGLLRGREVGIRLSILSWHQNPVYHNLAWATQSGVRDFKNQMV